MAPSTGTVRRLISLVAMLALVIGAMRFVRQPETANKLGRAFGLPHKSTSAARGEPVDFRGEGMDDDAAAASSLTEPPQATSSSSVRKEPTGDSIDWSAVKDNAPFRTEEHETWFTLIDQTRDQTAAALQAASLGEVDYAQLRGQPEEYRGRVVSLRGVARRATLKKAPQNDRGISTYTQIWIAPAGGGEWPFVVYALELPAEFPRGDEICEPISVDAAFFKNWSYSYGAGTGVAPVAIATTVEWTPRATGDDDRRRPTPASSWPVVLLGAGAAATMVAWVVWRTRRPRRSSAEDRTRIDDSLPARDVGQRLAELAERDA